MIIVRAVACSLAWHLAVDESAARACRPGHQAGAAKIAAEHAAIARSGTVLHGSITELRTRCGRRSCD